MTAAQRNKGARGEREFCVLLSEHLGEKYFRQLGAARDGGPDVLIGEKWAVEVKRTERPEFIAWWAQAFRQALEYGRFPALAYRASRQPWTVAIPLDVILFGHVLWEEQENHAPWCPWEFTAKLTLEGFATVVREII